MYAPLDLRVLVWNLKADATISQYTQLSSASLLWSAFWWPVCLSASPTRLSALKGPETHLIIFVYPRGNQCSTWEGRHRFWCQTCLPRRRNDTPVACVFRERRGIRWEQVTGPNERANSDWKQWHLTSPIKAKHRRAEWRAHWAQSLGCECPLCHRPTEPLQGVIQLPQSHFPKE